jgi:hypothetical protein
MSSETVSSVDTDVTENRIAAGITSRLNEAISKGQAAEIARRAGVPYPTLRDGLAGRQMRPAALVQIARATGVRVEWLLTGEGPMRPEEAPAPAAPPAAPAEPFRLFGRVKIDRMVDALEGALRTTRGADMRLTAHLTVVLYDQLSAAAEAAEKPASDAGERTDIAR